MPKPVTEQTKKQYSKRCGDLYRLYKAEVAHLSGEPSMEGFIAWLVARRPTLAKATWRQYRAAVCWCLGQLPHSDRHRLIEELRRAANPADPSTLPSRTSHGKAKHISPDDLRALQDRLLQHPSRWSALANAWLRWTVVTGLRPTEWRHCQVSQEQPGRVVMAVQNAKATQGRAHGEMRTIAFAGLDLQQTRELADFAFAMRAFAQQGHFDRVYDGVRLTIHRVGLKLWPRRKRPITLYSARHQFCADAKSAGLSAEAIAALMGHAVTVTHEEHYGRRRYGRGQVDVEPDQADMARVRRNSPGRTPKPTSAPLKDSRRPKG
ncbi:hypothetical protein [Thiomonas sp. FB-Cd]|uniref:hypothetical protein n=1 Tax=Thiomonas sp. FB-Cd TaxID=1158292 RepID=UPI0004DFB79B|nr:hypothetical protein [Thiomonas sp. FB-Cd]